MEFHQPHAAPGRIFRLVSLLQRSNFYSPDFLAKRASLSFKELKRMTYLPLPEQSPIVLDTILSRIIA